MKIWIITLFPEYFEPLLTKGVAASALKGERGVDLEVSLVQLRDFTANNYKGVDDSSYGGGPGMVIRADVLKNALVEGIVGPGGYQLEKLKEQLHIVYPSPRGKTWNHKNCVQFSKSHLGQKCKDLVFVCGRYEGIDERFIESYVDEEISIGDYILTGGELATMAILDSALRFMPGVLGNKESAESESFQDGLLEHPHYTKPRDFEGKKVPDVLLSGNHSEIEKWRNKMRHEITKNRRKDL